MERRLTCGLRTKSTIEKRKEIVKKGFREMKISVEKTKRGFGVYITSNTVGYMSAKYYYETASTEIDAATKVISEMMKNGDTEPANETMQRFKKHFNNPPRQIKIIAIDEDTITFDDGSYIVWTHDQDCCEHTYADFSQIEDCVGMKFNTPMEFEKADNYGFRFGNGINMVFVPCYSIQNGYYSAFVDVDFYDSKTDIHTVNSFKGELIYG